MAAAAEELVNLILNHHGDEFEVVVGMEVATKLLNDPVYAETYINKIKNSNTELEAEMISDFEGDEPEYINDHELEEVNYSDGDDEPEKTQQSNLTSVWNSKGKPTQACEMATLLLLQLRDKYTSSFKDKKTNKKKLWQMIANALIDVGYKVDGKKCQQKFSNLQKSYIKFTDNMKTTGSSKKDPPPYYEELHGILGCKDKVNPKGTKDSLADENSSGVGMETSEITIDVCEASTSREGRFEASTLKQDMFETSTSEDNRSTPKKKCQEKMSKEGICNRFKNPNRLKKPKTAPASMLEEIRSQFNMDRETKQKHFEKLAELIDTQNKQRDRIIDLLERSLPRGSTRRQRYSSSSDDD